MISAETCLYQGNEISIDEAIKLREEAKQPRKELFQCIECLEPVRAHLASGTGTNHRAHFEHFKRNPNCRYSDSDSAMSRDNDISHPILDQYDSAYITSFWGWSPQTWGCVGFSQKGRLETILAETSDPFIMVIYVTQNAGEPEEGTDYRGMVAGFYVVSHNETDRYQSTDEKHHELEPDKWQYSLKAIRAYEIIPEDRPSIREFEPSIYQGKKAQAVSKHATQLSNQAFERLKQYSYREVPVYASEESSSFELVAPSLKTKVTKGYVSGGNMNGSGYYVPPERDSEKELYILQMNGSVEDFLGKNTDGKRIYKIGLSISPETRKNFFNKAMPESNFSWSVIKSTNRDGDSKYPNFKTAEKGEKAMKEFLAENAKHLGGEFYLASDGVITKSWEIGKSVARLAKVEQQS